jgi:hypothetical protein
MLRRIAERHAPLLVLAAVVAVGLALFILVHRSGAQAEARAPAARAAPARATPAAARVR